MDRVYVVEVFAREDGLYAFVDENDAQAFEQAVNRGELGIGHILTEGYESRCMLHTLPLLDSEASRFLIENEKESWS